VTRFVKSGSTSVPVNRSQGEVERILRRYGCSGFGFHTDYEAQRVAITFRVPDSTEKDAALIPVRLELDIRLVYDALFGRPTIRKWDAKTEKSSYEWNPKGYDEKGLLQAERVAWRQLVLWIDAACSAATAGVQKMSEAFFAHTVVRGDDGINRRMIDLVDQIGGGGWKALLPPAVSPE
jgi:hypothetical protein